MKKFTFILASLLFTLTAQTQTAKAWKMDKSHASVNFSIDHFFTAVTGKLKTFDGTFHFDPANLKASDANFTIQVSSIDTDDSDRNEHLQSGDFFDAKNHPTIAFKSTRIEKISDKEYTVIGNLTMRGTTKEVKLPLKIKGIIDNPWKEGSVIMGVEINTQLDRTNWGIGTGSWAATSVVGDEVDIKISMELDGLK
jgi:polyisoprenoid-binding protein YceI